MDTYSSGNPRVHISVSVDIIKAAINEYIEKIDDGTIEKADAPWFRELIGDLRQELSMRDGYKMIEDPGHGWLRVPLKEIVGMTFSKFSYADGEFAYLEEDCDAPKFMKVKSLQEQDIPTEHIDNDCFVRRLGGLPREFILKEQAFEECGCCGHYHRATFRGDCREDSERFTIDEIPEGSEVIDLESLIAEEN